MPHEAPPRLERLQDLADRAYGKLWREIGWHVPRGRNVFDADWDLLLILDACRVDALREVASEYPFLDDVSSKRSVGSMSHEWLEKTFTADRSDVLSRTAYVTANTFSEDLSTRESIGLLDEMWRYAAHEEYRVVPPEAVTARTIEVGRTGDFDRVLAHYMQPHEPFLDVDLHPDLGSNPFDEDVNSAKDFLRKGRISREEFWRGYRRNLERVLDSVADLLENFEAETVVITADHGEALGEWGVYGHPAGCLHPSVTDVPWVETRATDRGTLVPDVAAYTEGTVSREEQLRHLGYL